MIDISWIDFFLFVFVAAVWIELRAMKMSTHRVQYIDPFREQGLEEIEEPFQTVTEEQREEFKKEQDLFKENIM